MEKIGLNELRNMFREFYIGKDHYPQKSFSLIPEKDKSLLLINSGMAPLKPFFAGTETPPSKRMTTCQKCIRTGDIDNVGITARHATFFEMLGSFSFGDYFKKESIEWGWEFITKVLQMPEDRIWASIYEKDDEAHDLWRKMIGMPEERIVRLGKDDNFWEIGIGPCGPCSELYYDRGEKYGCDNPDCKPGCDCDRYVEFWNHVFTQYNRDEAGNYTPLPNPNIDTGMGLERLACIMQSVDSIFEIDTIKYILDTVVGLSGIDYRSSAAPSDISIRIITDHIRSVTFMICDGVLPSNEGRGYVLRRLLRRAARHGRMIGINGSFLAALSEKVIEISRAAYPELSEKESYIRKILTIEEEKFNETIDQGMHILEEYMEELKNEEIQTLSGEKAFKLYDTYGFPVELTAEILTEKNYGLDLDGFEAHMAHQKELARSARKADTDAGWAEEAVDYSAFGATVFTGYDNLEQGGIIIGIIKGGFSVKSAKSGDKVRIILDKTSFYAESGGQTADSGTIQVSGSLIPVNDCIKIKDVFLHDATLNTDIAIGMPAYASVDKVKRHSTARNHTATHILHKALKQIAGQHVEQAGSMVSPDRLRFDFKHFEALSRSDISAIEKIVNQAINEFMPVTTIESDMETAVQNGATALFGEKYQNRVRVVSVGDFSKELCGGTHVANSGQIGAFHILSESGVAAGIRRIEALTGSGIYQALLASDDVCAKAGEILKANPANLLTRLESLAEDHRELKKELDELKKISLKSVSEDIMKEARDVKGINFIAKKFENIDANELRSLTDDIKAKNKNVFIVFATVSEGKVTFITTLSDDLLDKGYHAGNMIKKIAAAAGGSGGGKADMAQAGAKDPEMIDTAFQVAEELL